MKNFWSELPRPFFILAPMEAVTDVVFRHVVAAAAPPDVFFTEFTNATGWVHAGDKAIGGRLVKTDDENPIVAQIWGGDPESMARLAAHCRDLGYHGIDINMGCPVKSAIKSGGSALIRNPELAAKAIASAKTAGLPVSVKTRLGYSRVDEWHEWIAHVLRQDIVNFTIHLRTKKEMSKVPAHYELIADIKKLRDEIAPQTLLTINGDIRDRAHGMELVEKYGVDGIMIGRGIFHNPFAFKAVKRTLALDFEDSAFPAAVSQERQLNQVAANGSEKSGASVRDHTMEDGRKEQLLGLLRLHLDLHDKYNELLPRKFDPLKRFFKIYIRDFEGASELRDRLMHTTSTDQVREILQNF